MNAEEYDRQMDMTAPPVEPGEQDRPAPLDAERVPTHPSPPEPMFWTDEELDQTYRSRWIAVQAEFVDDPTDSIRSADELVAEVIENVSNAFLDERSSLEETWAQNGDVSTEDPRVSMTRYRELFDRLMQAGENRSRYE
jgi:hypothetical protein